MARTLAARKLNRPRRLAFAMLVLLAAVYADQRGWLLVRRSDDYADYHGRVVRVLDVIDGDTLDVEAADGLHDRATTRVRLVGVDCPELPRMGRPAEPLAAEAAGQTAIRCRSALVTLWLEAAQPRDAFGRVLAHVELADGSRLNEALLTEGLARVEDRWPHTWLVRYAQAENAARRQRKGLWAESAR